MELFQRIWSVITGLGQSSQDMPHSSLKIASAGEKPHSKIVLVSVKDTDPYQDHTHQPHCDDHLLFTKDCASCQEIKRAQPLKRRPTSRSFGFTDNVTSASFIPTLGNLGPNPADAALQSLPAMLIKAEVPYRTISESLVANSLVDGVVDTVANLEIDSLRND
jgi:hypothetical protein